MSEADGKHVKVRQKSVAEEVKTFRVCHYEVDDLHWNPTHQKDSKNNSKCFGDLDI